MIKCANCECEAPKEVDTPRFCVRCGRPMAQPSPYDTDPQSEQVLMFRNEDGRAPAFCRLTGGLLRACPSCGRLYRILETQCSQCVVDLVEPATSFPSRSGSLDGSKSAAISGAFATNLAFAGTIDTEQFAAIAYRYGILVGASRNNLCTYTFDDGLWRQRTAHPMNCNATAIKDLILDDGAAFVVAQGPTRNSDAVMVFDLNGFGEVSPRERISQTCVMLRRGPAGEVRLTESSGSRVLHYRMGRDPFAALPQVSDAASIQDIAVGTHIALAFRDRPLSLLATDSGMLTPLPSPAADWVQLAYRGDVITGIGRTADGGLTLCSVTDSGTPVETRNIDTNYLGMFAWAGDKVFWTTVNKVTMAPIKGGQPKTADLAAGEETTDLLAISDQSGGIRLVVRRKSQYGDNLYVYEPTTGLNLPINVVLQAAPPALTALAETKLLIWMQDGNRSKLHTYNLEATGESNARR